MKGQNSEKSLGTLFMDDPKGKKEGQEHDFICCQTADRPGRSSGGGRGIKGGKLGVMQLLIIEEKTVQ